jgi:polyhydroxyalkanoate synthase
LAASGIFSQAGGELMEKPKIPVDLILATLAEHAEKTQDRVSKASDILLGPLDSDIAATP